MINANVLAREIAMKGLRNAQKTKATAITEKKTTATDSWRACAMPSVRPKKIDLVFGHRVAKIR